MDKITARKTGIRSRSFLTEKERRDFSDAIRRQVTEMIRDCRIVCIYVSKDDEADTSALILWCFEQGIGVAAPRVCGDSLEV